MLKRPGDVAALLAVVFAIFATVFYFPAHPFVDEYIHWPTAQQFAHGRWPLNPGISTWPTMNAVVGWTTAAIGQSGHLLAGRLIIVVFGLIAVAGFYRTVQQLDNDAAPLRTAQFFLSPVVLPFCALVYTDIPALACMMWAMVGALRRQAWLMIGAGFLACAFRQSDIVWFIAFAALFAWLSWRAGEALKSAHIVAILLVIAAWWTLVELQGGVASGVYTQADHPGGIKGLPNIWFALFVAAIIYAPYFLYRLVSETRGARIWRPRRIGVMVLTGMLVAFTFHVTHRLNLIELSYFMRNYLLHQVSTPLGTALFVIVATITSILVFCTPMPPYDELKIPLLLFSALSLLPFWLIEQRYDVPAFALFWALRAPVDRRIEIVQLLFGAACSVWIVVRIALGLNFL